MLGPCRCLYQYHGVYLCRQRSTQPFLSSIEREIIFQRMRSEAKAQTAVRAAARANQADQAARVGEVTRRGLL